MLLIKLLLYGIICVGNEEKLLIISIYMHRNYKLYYIFNFGTVNCLHIESGIRSDINEILCMIKIICDAVFVFNRVLDA